MTAERVLYIVYVPVSVFMSPVCVNAVLSVCVVLTIVLSRLRVLLGLLHGEFQSWF